MKYLFLGFTILLSIGWHLLQPNNAENNEYTKIHIHGKVHGLVGQIILNIEDNYLNLTASDQFTFIAHTSTKEPLILDVIDQPENQYCEIKKSNKSHNKMYINISCKIINRGASGDSIVAL